MKAAICYEFGKPLVVEDVALDAPKTSENRLHTHAGAPLIRGIKTAAFAEELVVDQSQVVKVPADLPLDRGCLLACGVITGLGAVVNTVHVASGSNVVVIGAGGVGVNSVQGARRAGAAKIIAIDMLDNKLEAARTLGATPPQRQDSGCRGRSPGPDRGARR